MTKNVPGAEIKENSEKISGKHLIFLKKGGIILYDDS